MSHMQNQKPDLPNRREFIRTGSSLVLLPTLPIGVGLSRNAGEQIPWYRRTYRWGQTNINEKDPIRYDIEWWREHWRRTKVQGLVINAGGIVAYYPSKYPLHYRPDTLGDRDLFGQLVEVAHRDGLAVLARMDSNRAHQDFYQSHTEWFAVNKDSN